MNFSEFAFVNTYDLALINTMLMKISNLTVVESAFLKVLNMSITAGYVILAILAVRICLRKMPKVFSYMLWIAAAFRLLCPISFSSIISIFNFRFFDLFDFSAAQSGGSGMLTYIPPDIGMMKTPKVTIGIPAANSVISESLPAPVSEAAANINSINPMQAIVYIAAIIWCIGIASLIVYSLVSYMKMRNRVDGAVLLEKNIYECDNIPSPFVMGFLKPKIYLPFRLSNQERDYILCHEKNHIRRLDHIIKPLSFLLLILHWFNPLAWVAYICMCRDMEMSCDEKVLSVMGMSIKKDYSMSLLSFSARRFFPAASPLAFGESGVKKRIRNILKSKKPRTWIIVSAVILTLGVIAVCTANPISDAIWSQSSIGIQDIYGFYEFEESIYQYPLLSYMPVKGFMPHFEIAENALRIIDKDDGSVQEFAGIIKKEPFDNKDFESMFKPFEDSLDSPFKAPDTSKYKNCWQFGVFKPENNDYDFEYRIYVMDNEIWLAQTLSGDTMGRIYRLVKTDGKDWSTPKPTDN